MSAPPFVLFGPAHLGALACIVAATLAVVVAARRGPERARRALRFALAGALLLGVASEQVVAALAGGYDPQLLPLHVCDVAVMLAIFSLVTLERRTVAPLYFYALSGTLPALVTPELPEGFPSFRFLIYFIPHGLAVASMFALVAGLRIVPRAGAWWRTFVLLNVHAALVGLVNWSLGTNFLYLARKPEGPTPFDWFGPWPYYILTLEAGFFTMFRLLDQPLRHLRQAPPDFSDARTGVPA